MMKAEIGDLIAFSGNGIISSMVKFITRSNISHVGAIIASDIMIESDIDAHNFGVRLIKFSKKVREYNGQIWLLKIDRKQFAEIPFILFLKAQLTKTYDIRQVIELGIAKYFPPYAKHIKENHVQYFCSELIATAYEKAGIISNNFNTSKISPGDLTGLKIYTGYNIIKGKTSPYPFNRKEATICTDDLCE